jgi:hypothetical protein
MTVVVAFLACSAPILCRIAHDSNNLRARPRAILPIQPSFSSAPGTGYPLETLNSQTLGLESQSFHDRRKSCVSPLFSRRKAALKGGRSRECLAHRLNCRT